MLDGLRQIAWEAFSLLAQMAPYLFVGILAAGVLHVLLPVGLVSKHLGKPGLWSVVKAAILGVPLPICSCGVVPLAASIKKDGASDGATVSFLVTTPTTGVDSILATYSLLGWPITIARVLSSLVLGVIAGAGTLLTGKRNERAELPMASADDLGKEGAFGKLKEALVYTFDELLGGLARPLFVGIVLGGLVAYFVPAGFIQEHVGTGFGSYFLLMALGIPLYVCASGSIPLAAALLMKGVSPGAALVFLIAGPATNLATVAVVSSMMGKRTLMVYLGVLVLGSVGAGYLADVIFGSFPTIAPGAFEHVSHEGHGLGVIEIVSGTALGLLVLFHGGRGLVAWMKRRKKMSDEHLKLNVPDMTCAHCARTITKAVSSLEGVKDLVADPATKEVKVSLEGADEETILTAIRDAGYTPTKKED